MSRRSALGPRAVRLTHYSLIYSLIPVVLKQTMLVVLSYVFGIGSVRVPSIFPEAQIPVVEKEALVRGTPCSSCSSPPCSKTSQSL